MNLHVARYVDRWLGLPLCLTLWALARALGRRLPAIGALTPPSGAPPARPKRVLGIKFYGLGNIVMILPTLHELAAAFPDVEIDFLTLPSNRDLLLRSGLVRRVLTVDVRGYGGFVRSVAELVGALRHGGYDTVLDFEQFMKLSGVFAFMTGAARTIGLNTEGQQRAWLYTTRVAYTDSEHTVDTFRRLLRPLGVAPGDAPVWRLPVTQADRERVGASLAARGTPGRPLLVVMHVGTGPNYNKIAVKRWDLAKFAAVADALVERHGATVVFTGQGPEEHALVAEAITLMRQPAIDTCDRLDVGSLAALLADAAFVLSNDTATMHLAGAVGTPVVALFGPTSPELYGPRGPRDVVFYKHLYCSPCLSNYNLKMSRCTDPVCMRSIGVEEVLAGIEAQYLGPALAAGSADR